MGPRTQFGNRCWPHEMYGRLLSPLQPRGVDAIIGIWTLPTIECRSDSRSNAVGARKIANRALNRTVSNGTRADYTGRLVCALTANFARAWPHGHTTHSNWKRGSFSKCPVTTQRAPRRPTSTISEPASCVRDQCTGRRRAQASASNWAARCALAAMLLCVWRSGRASARARLCVRRRSRPKRNGQ